MPAFVPVVLGPRLAVAAQPRLAVADDLAQTGHQGRGRTEGTATLIGFRECRTFDLPARSAALPVPCRPACRLRGNPSLITASIRIAT